MVRRSTRPPPEVGSRFRAGPLKPIRAAWGGSGSSTRLSRRRRPPLWGSFADVIGLTDREMRYGFISFTGWALLVAGIGVTAFLILQYVSAFALPVLAIVALVLLFLMGCGLAAQSRYGWALMGIAVIGAFFAVPWADHKFFEEAWVPGVGRSESWPVYYEELDEAGFQNLGVRELRGFRSEDCVVVSTEPKPGSRIDLSSSITVVLDCPE